MRKTLAVMILAFAVFAGTAFGENPKIVSYTMKDIVPQKVIMIRALRPSYCEGRICSYEDSLEDALREIGKRFEIVSIVPVSSGYGLNSITSSLIVFVSKK